jgi:hypothetical protein
MIAAIYARKSRQILKKLLTGALLFSPKEDEDERYYEFGGQASLAKILAGSARSIMVASPTGHAYFRLASPTYL